MQRKHKKSIGLGVSVAPAHWNAEEQKETDDCPDRDNIPESDARSVRWRKPYGPQAVQWPALSPSRRPTDERLTRDFFVSQDHSLKDLRAYKAKIERKKQSGTSKHA